MANTQINLSKSKYCCGIQCPKMLWMGMNMPDEAVQTASETVLENGNKVGDLARNYFGAYSLVEYSTDKRKMCHDTECLISDGVQNIAEASFIYNGLYCAVDILHKGKDGWEIVEVKSSTDVSDIYIDDMSFQYYVLTQSGLKVSKVCILYINSKYVRMGDLDLKKLFAIADYTDECKKRAVSIADKIASMRTVAALPDEPDISIGPQCLDPYECAYMNYCWRNIPSPSVFDIRGMFTTTKFKLYNQQIVTFEDLRNNLGLIKNQKQKMQVTVALNHESPVINKENVRSFVNSLCYPIYHLDFETFQMAIPEFDHARPYEQIPFQYSLHVEQEDGSLAHYEFLAKEGTDPRRAIAESLCRDIPAGSFCMAYHMSFEKARIKTLAELFPDLSTHLMSIHENMHDLEVPFKAGDYYCEEMQGSSSIKYVLPALCPGDPELDYHNLDQVHNGMEATAAFLKLTKLPPEEAATLRKNLLKYCGLDTFAMVKVLQKLREV